MTDSYFLGLAKQPFKLNLKTPTPHASANQFTDTQYSPALVNGITSERTFFNFADLTPAIGPTDREYLYGSFDRDLPVTEGFIRKDFRLLGFREG